MGMRLGQRGIVNRRAGRRRPRVLEFGVQRKSSVTELSVNFHPWQYHMVFGIRSSDNDSTGFWPPGWLHTLVADGYI